MSNDYGAEMQARLRLGEQLYCIRWGTMSYRDGLRVPCGKKIDTARMPSPDQPGGLLLAFCPDCSAYVRWEDLCTEQDVRNINAWWDGDLHEPGCHAQPEERPLPGEDLDGW